MDDFVVLVAAGVVVVLALVVLGVLAGWFGWFARLGSPRLLVRQPVVVNLLSGSAIEGVVWRRRGRYLVLRNATLLEPGSQAVTMDGEVVLDRDRVDFVQSTGR
jgi:hypothetical protein